MKAELIPLDGRPSIELVKDVSVAGRNEDCDLRIDRRSVSKMHCILVKTEGFLFIRDLASTNGTKVNGQRVLRAALLPGDKVTIGGEKFRVSLGPDDSDSLSDIPTDALAVQPREPDPHKPESDKQPPTPTPFNPFQQGPAEPVSLPTSDVVPAADAPPDAPPPNPHPSDPTSLSGSAPIAIDEAIDWSTPPLLDDEPTDSTN